MYDIYDPNSIQKDFQIEMKENLIEFLKELESREGIQAVRDLAKKLLIDEKQIPYK